MAAIRTDLEKEDRPSRIDAALDAFVDDSPVDRAMHADCLNQPITAAKYGDLGALTRLACVMENSAAWMRIQTLLRRVPDCVYLVVAAAPWDDVHATVQTTILNGGNDSEIDQWSAAAFFAALDLDVWNAMDAVMQRRWLNALDGKDAHLAIRSPSLSPEVPARARRTNDLVHAARRHAPDEDALRRTFSPILRRDLGRYSAYALLAALPDMPSNLDGFFVIASKGDKLVHDAQTSTVLRTPPDLALAVTLQLVASGRGAVQDACMTVEHVLRARSWNDAQRFLALLDDAARAAFMPNLDALAADLFHLDRCDAIRWTLDAIAALSAARIRALLPRLPQDIQHALRAHPAIAAALADLDEIPPSTRATRGAPGAIRRRR